MTCDNTSLSLYCRVLNAAKSIWTDDMYDTNVVRIDQNIY